MQALLQGLQELGWRRDYQLGDRRSLAGIETRNALRPSQRNWSQSNRRCCKLMSTPGHRRGPQKTYHFGGVFDGVPDPVGAGFVQRS